MSLNCTGPSRILSSDKLIIENRQEAQPTIVVDEQISFDSKAYRGHLHRKRVVKNQKQQREDNGDRKTMSRFPNLGPSGLDGFWGRLREDGRVCSIHGHSRGTGFKALVGEIMRTKEKDRILDSSKQVGKN
jgi:hypothetical protein